ncbi:MAG: 16S rRNA (cytosine(1402)-N(4))-methyltransferase RsmH [Proteobacteria bacterium]|nr:16S rRNA (cytosine(1402)-N(4))-methyltransferase RsmH [Pseudomonadota bacterium]
MGFAHIPVLLGETLEALVIQPDGTYVDCTAGGGGHSSAIATRLGPDGRLVSLDRDPSAVSAATARIEATLADTPEAERPTWSVTHTPFSGFERVLGSLGLEPGSIDGVLADLGVSSPQLDHADRGFSFSSDGPLDMRMDPTSGPIAAELVATLDERDLADAIFRLADERGSRRIARTLVQARAEAPITTTAQLADLVSKALGGRRGARIHPATKTFQALRLLVNGELDELSVLLEAVPRWLRVGGRFAVITFHSGEDRPVKRRFVDLSKGCVCPPSSPICTCGKKPQMKLIGRKGLVASDAETSANPRSRTARLRVIEKLEGNDEG